MRKYRITYHRNQVFVIQAESSARAIAKLVSWYNGLGKRLIGEPKVEIID